MLPLYDGFKGKPKEIDLKKGTHFDRYGGYFDKEGEFVDKGEFVAPSGVPFHKRSLPNSKHKQPLKKYRVLKPISNVLYGEIAPWFGKPGGGTQYKFLKSIDKLLKEEFIERLN